MNLCRSCRSDFTSVRLFDAHRVGKHEYDWSLDQPDGRRCLDSDEMAALGWEVDSRGRWSDPVRAAATREAFSRMSRRSQTRRKAA